MKGVLSNRCTVGFIDFCILSCDKNKEEDEGLPFFNSFNLLQNGLVQDSQNIQNSYYS
jgi:hypothetical protein